jgi:hypothetical protein
VNWDVDAGQRPFFGCLNLEGYFHTGTLTEGVLAEALSPQMKAAESSRYILMAGGLDEKGDLWSLRGQDVEERQRLRLLSTFLPYISFGTRLLSTIEYETNSVSLGDVILKYKVTQILGKIGLLST